MIVADAAGPPRITGAAIAGAPLRLVNVRNGDVACTHSQRPTGSAALFQLGEAERAAVERAGLHAGHRGCGRREPRRERTAGADGAGAALDGWADGLKKP